MGKPDPMRVIYCVDTSSWIELKERYPPRTFLNLWNKLDTLVKSSRVISPQEVYGELDKKDDEVLKWVKQRKQMFVNLNDEEQIALVFDIEAKFPKLVDPQKETPEADPFVIALAVLETKNRILFGDECIVVSEEKPGGGGISGKPKIPDVCYSYGVRHFSILDLIQNEGWTF